MSFKDYDVRLAWYFNEGVTDFFNRTLEVRSDVRPDVLLQNATDMKEILEYVRHAFGTVRAIPSHPNIVSYDKINALHRVNRVLNRIEEQTQIVRTKPVRTAKKVKSIFNRTI